jgi:methylenetetrahydrofolate reductase (NADPH)
MRGLQSAPSSVTAPISGFHVFPFGGLRKAANWLRGYDAGMAPLPHAASATEPQNP